MTLPADFDIRYSTMDDHSVLQEWFKDPIERRPFPFETDAETEEAVKNWIGFSKYKATLTGTLADSPCAIGTLLLMPYRKVAHHASFYLIVAPQHRFKGIGTSMVGNLIHLAKTRFSLESISVEVYEPNGLLQILSKLRFELFARQENFIKIDGNPHARILMERFFV